MRCVAAQDLPCGTADAYWTGFYTSKPYQKALSFHQDRVLREAEVLFAVRPNQPKYQGPSQAWYNTLMTGREASGVLQHHDGACVLTLRPAACVAVLTLGC